MNNIDYNPDPEGINELRRIRAKAKRLNKSVKKRQLLEDAERVQNLGGNLQLIINAAQVPATSQVTTEFDLSDSQQFPAVQEVEDTTREFPGGKGKAISKKLEDHSSVNCCNVEFGQKRPGDGRPFKGNESSLPKNCGISNEVGPRLEPRPSRIKSNKPFTININDLIVHKQPQSKPSEFSETQKYLGNPLDADKPQRHFGKCKETPDEKQISALKRNILIDNEIRRANGTDMPLIKYIPYVLTPELELKLLEFMKELVRCQRKMYATDKAKAQTKKRYVLGLSQCRRHVLGNQVKLLIIAADHKISREEDTLLAEIKKICDMCVERNVEVMYAFNKRKLGNITKTFCIISCMAVLNCDGIQDQLNAIFKDYDVLKKQTNP